jgi:hypothetical protein
MSYFKPYTYKKLKGGIMQLDIDDYENKLLYDIIGDYIGIEKKFNQELKENKNGEWVETKIPIHESDRRIQILTMLRARL